MSNTPAVGVVPPSPTPPGPAPTPTTQPTAADLSGFHKIDAERRERATHAPLEVPFGSGTIRVHATMPADFIFNAQTVEVDPYALKTALRQSIIPDDHERFDAILALPPSHAEGIDGTFLLAFIGALTEMYTGVPLDVRSR